MTTKYERCKKKVINDVLKSYEKKGTVKKTQAIAIALSISEKQCKKKINKDDYIKMEQKIDKMVNKNKIQQTNIKNAIHLLKYLRETKNYSKKIRLENKIMRLMLSQYIYNTENKQKLDKIVKNFIKHI